MSNDDDDTLRVESDGEAVRHVDDDGEAGYEGYEADSLLDDCTDVSSAMNSGLSRSCCSYSSDNNQGRLYNWPDDVKYSPCLTPY